jgi:hypothetical protein
MFAEAPPPKQSAVVEGLFKLAVTTRRPFCARGGLLLPVDEVVVVVVAVDAPKLAERAGRGMGRSPAEVVVVRPPWLLLLRRPRSTPPPSLSELSSSLLDPGDKAVGLRVVFLKPDPTPELEVGKGINGDAGCAMRGLELLRFNTAGAALLLWLVLEDKCGDGIIDVDATGEKDGGAYIAVGGEAREDEDGGGGGGDACCCCCQLGVCGDKACGGCCCCCE